MSSNRTHDKAKSQSQPSEPLPEKNQSLPVPQTPVKRQALVQSNFYLALSPLPFPPKVEHTLIDPSAQFSNYSTELRYVETPVVKEPSKFMPIQEDEYGIVNKIIFESSDEDANNNSSSMESSEGDSEDLSLSSEPQESEEKDSEPSQINENRNEQLPNGLSGDNERESKGRRVSKSRINTVSKEPNSGKKVFCNCKKTKCLKLYCDCFRLNQTCEGCNCVGCHNLEIYSEERSNAILALMDRNPDPFGQKIEDHKHVKGCNCKKSNCLKKYCECYQAGLKCGQNCKCEECKNMPPEKGCQGDRGGPAISKNTAKKERKMVEI